MQFTRYSSFLVRLWREHSEEHAESDWSGEVEHIQSGWCWNFATLDELLDVLRQIGESRSSSQPTIQPAQPDEPDA